ncbi:MAG: hypothetical protein EOL89_02540, partial [Actinobacteria bacterium]|nr:hypothetical protein [Actinomycetota bacterium]
MRAPHRHQDALPRHRPGPALHHQTALTQTNYRTHIRSPGRRRTIAPISGVLAYHQAKAAGLLDGWTRAVRTPSGGLHLHYPGTDQRNGTLPGQHLDFRATGGYVLLPPSLGQCKAYSRRYEILETRPGPGRPLDWAAITALLQPPATRREPTVAARRDGVDPIPWLAAHVAKQPEGNRDN